MVLCVWQSNVGDFEIDWIKYLLPENSIIINETEKTEKYPNEPCIFVTNYWIDFIPLIQNVKHPFGIIYLSEEILCDKIDYFISNPLCQFIWRNYIHPKYLQNPLVKFFPCSYKKDFTKFESNYDKEYLWSFAGSVHHQERRYPIDLYTFKFPDSYKIHETPPLTFDAPEGLSTKDYRELIQKSKYVICPPGKIIMECSRIYEALEAGAIPITIANHEKHLDYRHSYHHYVFPKHFAYIPFIIAESWEDTIEIVKKIEDTNQYNAILNECKDFWSNCKKYWKNELANDIKKLNTTRFSWKQILDAPSYIINLQRKPLLLSRCMKRVQEAGYTNVNHFIAVDGLNDNLEEVWKLHNNPKFNHRDTDFLNPKTPFIQAILLSLLGSLKQIIDNNIPISTIFEDDIIFHKNWHELAYKYYEITPNDFDMIYIGQHCGKGFNNHIAKNLPVYALHAFIITLKGATYLYNKIINDPNGVWTSDCMIYNYMIDNYKGKNEYLTWYVWNSEMFPDNSYSKHPVHGDKEAGLVFQEYNGCDKWSEKLPD